MKETIKKSLHAGIGLFLKTKDEVEEFAKELIEKGKMSEQEGKKFVDELLEKYETAKAKLEAKIEKVVGNFVKKSDMATKDEITKLKKEIEELKKSIKAANK